LVAQSFGGAHEQRALGLLQVAPVYAVNGYWKSPKAVRTISSPASGWSLALTSE
jgi:hypothetical protein